MPLRVPGNLPIRLEQVTPSHAKIAAMCKLDFFVEMDEILADLLGRTGQRSIVE
jgi:hypothetical protein